MVYHKRSFENNLEEYWVTLYRIRRRSNLNRQAKAAAHSEGPKIAVNIDEALNDQRKNRGRSQQTLDGEFAFRIKQLRF
jgi:hypothetical protein